MERCLTKHVFKTFGDFKTFFIFMFSKLEGINIRKANKSYNIDYMWCVSKQQNPLLSLRGHNTLCACVLFVSAVRSACACVCAFNHTGNVLAKMLNLSQKSIENIRYVYSCSVRSHT